MEFVSLLELLFHGAPRPAIIKLCVVIMTLMLHCFSWMLAYFRDGDFTGLLYKCFSIQTKVTIIQWPKKKVTIIQRTSGLYVSDLSKDEILLFKREWKIIIVSFKNDRFPFTVAIEFLFKWVLQFLNTNSICHWPIIGVKFF